MDIIDEPSASNTPEEFINLLRESPGILLEFIIYSDDYTETIEKVLEAEGLTKDQKDLLLQFFPSSLRNFINKNQDQVIAKMVETYQNAQYLPKQILDIVSFKALYNRLTAVAETISETDFTTLDESGKQDMLVVMQRSVELLDQYTELLRTFYSWTNTEWGSFRSRAGLLVVHDFLKPISLLLGAFVFCIDQKTTEESIETYLEYESAFNVNANLIELISQAEIVLKDKQNDVLEEDKPFLFSDFKNTLFTKFKNGVQLNLILDGEATNDFVFPNFEAWMSIHTYILNALSKGATKVTINVDNTNAENLIIRVIDNVLNEENGTFEWGSFIQKFLNSYETGKVNPNLPKKELDRGGETSAYLLGQIHTLSGSEEELLSYSNNESSKWVEVKFPKAA